LNAFGLIKNSKYILIATHENPDTDTLCCAIAIGLALGGIGKKYKIFNKNKTIHNKYKIFENYHKITDIQPKFYDLSIFVDCANISRIGTKLNINTVIINIDHHQSNDNFGDINIVNTQAVSCGLVVYEFFKTHNITISQGIASALYLSIYHDSFAFTKYSCRDDIYNTINILTKHGAKPNQLSLEFLQNDSLSKHRLYPKIHKSLELHNSGTVATILQKQKWLNQTKADINSCDDIAYDILAIKVVLVVIFFKEQKDGIVKASVRAKGGLDISDLSRYFDGGGHKSSISLKFKDKSIKYIKKVLINKLKDLNIVS
jgi:phosphoesterase RecJ-like protein